MISLCCFWRWNKRILLTSLSPIFMQIYPATTLLLYSFLAIPPHLCMLFYVVSPPPNTASTFIGRIHHPRVKNGSADPCSMLALVHDRIESSRTHTLLERAVSNQVHHHARIQSSPRHGRIIPAYNRLPWHGAWSCRAWILGPLRPHDGNEWVGIGMSHVIHHACCSQSVRHNYFFITPVQCSSVNLDPMSESFVSPYLPGCLSLKPGQVRAQSVLLSSSSHPRRVPQPCRSHQFPLFRPLPSRSPPPATCQRVTGATGKEN